MVLVFVGLLAAAVAQGGNRIEICHYPQNAQGISTGPVRKITISQSSLQTHLEHKIPCRLPLDDGSCPPLTTAAATAATASTVRAPSRAPTTAADDEHDSNDVDNADDEHDSIDVPVHSTSVSATVAGSTAAADTIAAPATTVAGSTAAADTIAAPATTVAGLTAAAATTAPPATTETGSGSAALVIERAPPGGSDKDVQVSMSTLQTTTTEDPAAAAGGKGENLAHQAANGGASAPGDGGSAAIDSSGSVAESMEGPDAAAAEAADSAESGAGTATAAAAAVAAIIVIAALFFVVRRRTPRNHKIPHLDDEEVPSGVVLDTPDYAVPVPVAGAPGDEHDACYAEPDGPSEGEQDEQVACYAAPGMMYSVAGANTAQGVDAEGVDAEGVVYHIARNNLSGKKSSQKKSKKRKGSKKKSKKRAVADHAVPEIVDEDVTYDMPDAAPEEDARGSSEDVLYSLADGNDNEEYLIVHDEEDVLGFPSEDEGGSEDDDVAATPVVGKIDPSVYEGMTSAEIEEYNRGIRAKLEADTLVKGHTFNLSRELRSMADELYDIPNAFSGSVTTVVAAKKWQKLGSQ